MIRRLLNSRKKPEPVNNLVLTIDSDHFKEIFEAFGISIEITDDDRVTLRDILNAVILKYHIIEAAALLFAANKGVDIPQQRDRLVIDKFTQIAATYKDTDKFLEQANYMIAMYYALKEKKNG